MRNCQSFLGVRLRRMRMGRVIKCVKIIRGFQTLCLFENGDVGIWDAKAFKYHFMQGNYSQLANDLRDLGAVSQKRANDYCAAWHQYKHLRKRSDKADEIRDLFKELEIPLSPAQRRRLSKAAAEYKKANAPRNEVM